MTESNMTHAALPPFREVPFIDRDIDIEQRHDGVVILRNRIALRQSLPHIPALLRAHSAERSDATWLAQRRGTQRSWQRLSYGHAQVQVDAVTQALLDMAVGSQSIMILSGNSLEHGVLALAAMQARIPFAAITPAYSLLSQDHEKLKAIARLLHPAVIFVQNACQFEAALRALRSLDGLNARVVCVDDPVPELCDMLWATWLETTPGSDVPRSVAMIEPTTVAKYLFTSGSTGIPKAVIVTQQVLTHAVAMQAQLMRTQPMPSDSVMLDWMPWSHVAGGSSVFHSVLNDGGTLYIDDGKPTPKAFDETLRNLREISPLRFVNMPIGYAMLADALERDEELARRFFLNLQTMAYAGARLPDDIYVRLQALAVRHTGCRIPFVSGYGATETGPSALYVYWPTNRVGLCGLPHPGVEVKLVPLDHERFEVHVRSQAVTSGYLEQPELTRQAFDEEGYFKMGDAATFVDRVNPREGLMFAGRVSEEFKLTSGTFVRVGALRVQVIDAVAPFVSDVVITGADRVAVGALIWPNVVPCRELLGRPDATLEEIARSPLFRARLQSDLRRYNALHPGSSSSIARAFVLDTPPSMDAGEITDKGYVNQRTVLARRASEVQKLYEDASDASVIRLA